MTALTKQSGEGFQSYSTPDPWDYAERLYGSYVSNHMAHIRNISLDAIRRDFPIFKYSLRGALPNKLDADIVDIGCGYGALVYYIQSCGFTCVSGVDRSPEMADAARRLGIQNVIRADTREFLRERSNTYSLITAFDVIEHMHKHEVLPMLDDILCALQPGGTFVMQVPNAMSRYGQWYRYYDFTHELIFDGQSVRQCFNAVGFTNVQVRPVPPIVHGFASAIRRAYWALREPLLKMSFALESGWQPGQVFTANLIATARKPS